MTGGTCGSDQAVETVETYEILEDQEEADSSNPLFTWTPLDEAVIDLLKKLKKQADKIYKVNVTKARAKRTFVCGLHESFKHVMADNVKCIIVARNFEAELFEALPLFHRLRLECFNRDIPIVYASSKRCLSRAVKRFPYTNVIALFRFQAFEELYRQIISMSQKSDSQIHYHIDQPSLFA
ncbi:Selenocysteine insertion sequence-binding protein 2 [Parelaphostrongylus tenuis]|uniref:Selenocysteine insertion sequence-binding protein 2 n=1 Tax=Parelaphostrongylus tenuis TaxID=148309 RepID=A0AAD5N9L6_PARTN|nr:Selenocysteine insertion sequence-binding protein 2 [Parelaphostrongylus tenuis]